MAERTRLANSGRFLATRTQALAVTPAEGQALVDALDIPAGLHPTFGSLVSADVNAAVVRNSYGVIQPTHHDPAGGDSFLLLSTGASGDERFAAEPGTDVGDPGPADDVTTLQFQVTVPPGANRMSFDYTFLSAESPDFIGTQFNDTFTATVSDALGANRVIASASVNLAVFHPASDTLVGPCPFQLYVDNPAGVNTVFNHQGFTQMDAGTTGYQHVDVAVSSGPVTVTFDIRDLGDGILDSAVIIDNVQFSALEIVDPQGGMIDTFRGQVIRTTSTDPSDLSRLATGGAPVHAAAADGVSEIVLRASVPGPGTADFAVTGDANDGSLSTDDGPPLWTATAHTNAVLIGGKWYVFALYRSPPDFNRGGDEIAPARSAALTMDYTPAPGAGNAIHQDVAIDLVRPPVIVVPDIWAGCGSWMDIHGLLVPNPSDPSLQRFTLSCVDYRATSSRSFDDDDNRSALDQAIRQALQKQRDAGVAATRADVIGHGMGAVLARRYIDDPGYARFDNFNAGGINRLILMNAPNLGARLIDEMIRTRDSMKATNPTRWTGTKNTLAAAGVHFDNADQDLALEQMATTSSIISHIGATPARPTTVYYHAIASDAGHSLSRAVAMPALFTGGVAAAIKNFYVVMELNHPATLKPPLPGGIPDKQSLIFGNPNPAVTLIFCNRDPINANDQHDLLATVPEQAGGLTGLAASLQHVDATADQSGHFKVQNNQAHTTELIALLNASVTGGKFATSMPSPGSLPSTNDCPIVIPPNAPVSLASLAPTPLLPQTIAIASPAAGATVSPGQTVSVTVDAGGGEVPTAVLIIGAGSSELVEAAPFTADLAIPADAIGSTSLFAIAFYADGGMAFAEPVALHVDVAATIASLEVVNRDQVLRRPGKTRRLTVLATYSDGVRRDITDAAFGTHYTVSQLGPIATVSDGGVITAIGPGDATVAVSNGAAITSINVKVGEPSCGDGVLDPGEECDDGNLVAGDHCDPTCRIENAAPLAVCTSPTSCNDPGLCSANLTNLAAGSSDPDGDPLSFTQSPAAPYAIGQHVVVVDVSDGRLTAQCTSNVNVLDCEPPELTCPAPIVAECTRHGKAFVTPGQAASSDLCGSATVTGPQAGWFPLGTTQVDYASTDASGNRASCRSTIDVVDTQPPHARAHRTVTLWPPSHDYRRVSLDDCDIAVHDACGGRLPPSVYQARITCVTSDEPDDADGGRDGHTRDDIVLVDETTVKLRAERDAQGDGRVYRIRFAVRDASGNLGDGVCSVVVPHDADCARYPDRDRCRILAGDPENTVCAAAP